jgi:hypothetical protein
MSRGIVPLVTVREATAPGSGWKAESNQNLQSECFAGVSESNKED